MIPARSALRAVVYSTFYRLPHPLRIKLVRLLVPKYVVGAVVFVRDSECDTARDSARDSARDTAGESRAASAGRLLLLRQPPGRGWSLPAGLLRKREEAHLGALRELVEETGIRLTADQLTPAVPNAVVHSQGWVDMVFEASVPASTTALVADGAEVWEVAWHPLDDLPQLTGPTARLLGRYGIGPLAGYPDVPAQEPGAQP